MKELFIKKPTKLDVIIHTAIAIWTTIILVIVILLDLPSWPMLFASTAFFMMGSEIKKLPSIFIGAFTGLCGAVLFVLIFYGLYSTSFVLALVVALFVVLAILLVGGCFLPGFFNNVSFFYWAAAVLDMSTAISNFGLYTAVLVIGGAIFVGGTLLIVSTISKLAAPKA